MSKHTKGQAPESPEGEGGQIVAEGKGVSDNPDVSSCPDELAEIKELESEIDEYIEHKLLRLTETFSGPLPPPQILAGYESVIPGAADRILSMAEEQGRHRRKLEEKLQDAEIKLESRNSLVGLILASLLVLQRSSSPASVSTMENSWLVSESQGAG